MDFIFKLPICNVFLEVNIKWSYLFIWLTSTHVANALLIFCDVLSAIVHPHSHLCFFISWTLLGSAASPCLITQCQVLPLRIPQLIPLGILQVVSEPFGQDQVQHLRFPLLIRRRCVGIVAEMLGDSTSWLTWGSLQSLVLRQGRFVALSQV